jgi:hypothetical protein
MESKLTDKVSKAFPYRFHPRVTRLINEGGRRLLGLDPDLHLGGVTGSLDIFRS